MSKKRSILLAVLLVMVMVIATAIPVAADTTATVTVTAVPAFVSITTNATGGGAWTINGIVGINGTGTGVLLPNTTYYANYQDNSTWPSSTVATNECYIGLGNTSTVNINIAANMADFTGGAAPMTNGAGTAGANAFAAWISEEGSAWPGDKVVLTTSTGSTFWTSGSAGDDIGLVVEFATQTGDWTDATSQSSTIVLTATAS